MHLSLARRASAVHELMRGKAHTLMSSPVIATAQYVLCSPHGIKLAAFLGSLRKNVCTLVRSSIGHASCPTIPKNQTHCVSRGCDASSRTMGEMVQRRR